jgi:hypothetical protein
MPRGLTTPAIHWLSPSRSSRKWWRYISGEVGFSSLCGWIAPITASLSYSFSPGHASASALRSMPCAMPLKVSAWRRSVPVTTASKVMPFAAKYSPRRRLCLWPSSLSRS